MTKLRSAFTWLLHWTPGPFTVVMCALVLMVYILFTPSVQPFPVWHTFTLTPQFHHTAFIIPLGFFLMCVPLLFYYSWSDRKPYVMEPDKPFILYPTAGPREEPVYNWLLVYTGMVVCILIDSRTGHGLQKMLIAVFPDNWILPGLTKVNSAWVAVSGTIVSIIFGVRHVNWKHEAASAGYMRRRFALSMLINLLLIGVTFTAGAWFAMLFHSLYDLYSWFLDYKLFPRIPIPDAER